MKCQHCGKETFLPFKCPFCSGYFCVEHRLPENHACPEYWRAKIPREEPRPIIVERPAPSRRRYVEPIAPLRPRPTGVFWFTLKELKHLALGALLVMGVGLSLSLFWFIPMASPLVLVSLAVIFTSSFFLHEIAHKLTAQYFGFWAEFRLTTVGALLTLISILPTPLKIISPGAVMIAGSGSRETLGKISLAGPLTNLVLSAIFVGVATLSKGDLLTIALLSALINAFFIAFFNLIPFGIFDGRKVFRWNKAVWAAAFLLSLALTIYTFSRVGWLF